jgi:hypothetical protein
MNKKESDELTNSLLIADALLRIKSIENLLIAKGIFTKEELSAEMNSMTKQIAKSILEKANIKGDIDELIKSIQNAQATRKDQTEN